MAIIRKSLNEILSARPAVDKARLAKTTEQDISTQKLADGFAENNKGKWIVSQGMKTKRVAAELVS